MRGSVFFRRPDAAMAPVFAKLAELKRVSVFFARHYARAGEIVENSLPIQSKNLFRSRLRAGTSSDKKVWDCAELNLRRATILLKVPTVAENVFPLGSSSLSGPATPGMQQAGDEAEP